MCHVPLACEANSNTLVEGVDVDVVNGIATVCMYVCM